MAYKLVAFYAPKSLNVNAFDKSFDFESIKRENGVGLVFEKPYTTPNSCRFDILTIQRLLKNEKNVKRKGKVVTKTEFVPKEIRDFASSYTFNKENCEYDSVKEEKLEHGGQTGNFKAELDDVDFFMVKQKVTNK